MTTDSERRQRLRIWRWRVFSATWLSYAGLYFARKPFSIVKANLGDAYAWDAEALGFVGAVYLTAYTLGQFVAGAAGNRWGPRLLLLIGMGGSIVANALLGFTNTIGAFAVLMALNGLFQATGWSNNVGTMGNWFHRRERGKVMGIWATNYQVGGVAANSLAAWVLGAYGFQWSFAAGSAVLLLVWIFFLFNQRNRPEDLGLPPVESPPGDEPDSGSAGSEPARAGTEAPVSWPRQIVINILVIGCFYFFVKFIRYALWSWAPYLLQKNYGLAGDDAGYLSTVFDLAGIAGVIVCGWLSDRFFAGRRAAPAFVFIVGMAASCLMLYTLGATSVLLFTISIGFIGFSLYGPDALMTGAAAIDVGAARRATLAAGVINGMGSLGAVIQEFALGHLLKSDSVTAVFGLLLGSAVLAAMCLGVLLLRNRAGLADV